MSWISSYLCDSDEQVLWGFDAKDALFVFSSNACWHRASPKYPQVFLELVEKYSQASELFPSYTKNTSPPA
jgi:hypothetical protein